MNDPLSAPFFQQLRALKISIVIFLVFGNLVLVIMKFCIKLEKVFFVADDNDQEIVVTIDAFCLCCGG